MGVKVGCSDKEEGWSQRTLSRGERTKGATTTGVRSRNSPGCLKEYCTENYTTECSIMSNLVPFSILSKEYREVLAVAEK
jgi:hypothetical protein